MERLRAIATPDEPDPSFSVPCRRCARLLQEGNRFCLFCFADQLAPVAVDNARPAIEPRDGIPASDEAPAPEGFDFMDTVQPGAQEGASAAAAGSDFETDLVGFDPSRASPPQAGGAKTHWTARFATSRHLAIGAVPVLVLIGLAFPELGRIDADDRKPAARPQAPELAAERVQAPSIPRVQPQQPLPVPQPQPLPAHDARETFSALGLDETAARPSPPPAAPPPVVSAPAVAATVTDGKACSDALAALALCTQK
ncbi:hypothetical protein [Variovorax sp. PBL-E5]|uniref:hypothetical protein n=1 Tax=Variovorax sp. PBL-E5 TaxID=434014 RepID=UPI001317132A|nr:hypothetical protein [Variovorax sp. PBL-E5]VTU45468.1 hypothetical protein E5P2_00189 [Variovorax sp. PBL-E5]